MNFRALAVQNHLKDADKPQTQREFLVYFFENMVEEKLVQPTFIFDFPVESFAACKAPPHKGGVHRALRTLHLRHGNSKRLLGLDDPLNQKERFEAQDRKRQTW